MVRVGVRQDQQIERYLLLARKVAKLSGDPEIGASRSIVALVPAVDEDALAAGFDEKALPVLAIADIDEVDA
jgi:hypothetical protein